ncbi:MAG TPA: FtsX-like permease family protein, partial [Bacteroidales bacterium]|nr:FtsX-like permease family protein [Bacteroidales bacterium]
KQPFRVVGVYRDLPPNRHFRADILLSFINWDKQLGENVKIYGWIYSGFYNYVKLRKGTDPKVIDEKLRKMIDTELGEFMAQYKLRIGYSLQPVTDIHLTSHYMHELGDNGNRNSVTFLYIIAWFIIVIAWINFVNLLSVNLIGRWGEISLRKVLGAGISDLIKQFVVESLIINLAAFILAVALFESLYPLFSNLTGVPSGFGIWRQAWFLGILVIILAAGILLAGLVPVWGILSRKLAVNLRNSFTGSKKAVFLRKVLLGFQFFMAMILIAGTISVYLQLQYLHEKETGNDKTGIVVMKAPRVGGKDLLAKRAAFKDEIENRPFVKAMAFSSVIPGKSNMLNRGGIIRKGQDPGEGNNYRITDADYHYTDVYSNVFIEGRNFSKERPADQDAVITNLTACRLLGYQKPSGAIGEIIMIRGLENKIIGVIEDFHQQSPRTDFEPQIFRLAERYEGYFSVKPDPSADRKEMIKSLQKEFEAFFPGNPFEYFYLEDFYNSQYKSEVKFGKVFAIFSILALFITLLGILSLSAFSAAQRSKEIGIRKVHGASMRQILVLLSMNYMVLLLVASILSAPVIYSALGKWLSNFSNRMEISVWIFIIPVMLVSLFSLIMVLVQSVKTARLNPADALVYE